MSLQLECRAALASHLDREVREVAAGAGEHAAALFCLAALTLQWQTKTPAPWNEILDYLDCCDMTVGNWLCEHFPTALMPSD